ncbi:MAG: mucoidy inhibitor MuiA family protein [Chloroflexi bacterium]|nr:mucoidy inhibitor MuiA family protein [Ardenticatenaceae bacterium]MBL1128084.1 mucoidy inhibitor MuiA family protein [Chloroflexota bacterium]NOG34155.1 mucoidy inhibitor MuiA family protein [Chloroflexota bacterium]GIK56846.1 MAG: hypothetical protein BroJett015_25090 [Chloroflexota bacterium]
MDVTLEATVERVVVYPDRARVTAVADCELETGIHRLLVDELPLVLEPESVRVSGQGTARVRIQSVDVNRHFYTETPAAQARDLELQIEQTQDEMQVLADEMACWQGHGKYLDGLRAATVEFAKGLSRGRTTVTDQVNLLDFLRDQDVQMRTAVRDLKKQERDLKRRLQKLQNELNQQRSARPRERYRAVVEIEVLAAGTFRTEVTYVVHNAGWQPLYDARLRQTDAGQTVELSYIAQITQQTGQDWTAVQLSVSTARPALNQQLPELYPWYLDVYMPPPLPAPQARAKMADRAVMAAPAMAAADAFVMEEASLQVADAEITTASVSSEGTAVTFQVPNPADIPSDGSPHKTTLQQLQLDPKLDYLCMPKHTDAVYRRVTITNSGSGPLLAGSASLFVGDEFIGRTNLAYTPTGGELELLLGVEERITVERELKKREVDKKMLRDVRRTRFGYEMELQNLLGTAVTIELHDHIPVSRNEQIKVRLENARPTPTEQSDLNELEWQLTLPAGAKQTIVYEFVVEHPPALRITGLSE